MPSRCRGGIAEERSNPQPMMNGMENIAVEQTDLCVTNLSTWHVGPAYVIVLPTTPSNARPAAASNLPMPPQRCRPMLSQVN